MCWAALAAWVAAIDAHALVTGRPTLSSAYRDASRVHPLAIGLATAYLLAHLTGALPAAVDPLRRLTTRGDTS